jgi:hypothetical protein
VVAVPIPPGVPGVVVVDGSGVDGEGVSVGRDMPGLVGGRVDVMKTDLVGEGVSSETLMHEPRVSAARKSNIQIFFIRGFYFGKIKSIIPTLPSITRLGASGRFVLINYGCAKTRA